MTADDKQRLIENLRKDLKDCVQEIGLALQEIQATTNCGAISHWKETFIEQQKIRSGLYKLINILENPVDITESDWLSGQIKGSTLGKGKDVDDDE